jgi:histidinol-phosphate/aromatic aminotransferase/cobyric acid decarboxylase-like protein
MTDQPKPLPQLAKVKIYVPGEAPKPGKGPSYKLASNENPLGASPKAKAAYIEMAGKLEVYPDGGAPVLKAAIAKKHGLQEAWARRQPDRGGRRLRRDIPDDRPRLSGAGR